MHILGTLLRIALVSGFLLISSCKEQEPPEGQLACVDDSDCPSGWFCDPSDDFCYADDAVRDGGTDTATE